MKILIEGRELSVDDEVIAKAIEEKKDVTIENSEFVIRTKTEEDSFVNNIKAESKTVGIEMAVKEARNTLGLDFQGKTIDNLIEAVKAKTLTDAKIEPEAKVKELMKDVDTLKGTISTLTGEKEQIQSQFHSFKSDSVINTTLASIIPENSTLPKEDMILLLKSKMKFQVNDKNAIEILGQDGQVMKDKTTLDPMDVNVVVKSFFDDNPIYVKGTGGGAGGEDSSGAGGKKTVEQFIEEKAKLGVSHTSPAFQTELQELMKQGLIT